jgi:4-hydroxy-3-methylbut-2-enyl diphosphate reductase
MRVIVAKSMGFCMGVRKAVNTVYNVIEKEKNHKIFTFGPIIHNPLVLEDLLKKGVKIIDNPDDAKDGVVIIRAHGVQPDIKKKLMIKAGILIDATCPRVLNSQKKVFEASEKGMHIIIAGDRNHGEVKGIAGYAKYADIIETKEDAEKLKVTIPALLISQTTFSKIDYDEICSILKTRYPDIDIAQSICPATGKRQRSLIDIANKADAIIVIGGKNSANSVRLYQTAVNLGKKAWHIEDISEIPSNIKIYNIVGVTAGASTPDWVIKDIIDKLISL